MFTGGAAPHALKPAHSLLPLPGQAHCVSAEKQHGVSFDVLIQEADICYCAYIVDVDLNIITFIDFRSATGFLALPS